MFVCCYIFLGVWPIKISAAGTLWPIRSSAAGTTKTDVTSFHTKPPILPYFPECHSVLFIIQSISYTDIPTFICDWRGSPYQATCSRHSSWSCQTYLCLRSPGSVDDDDDDDDVFLPLPVRPLSRQVEPGRLVILVRSSSDFHRTKWRSARATSAAAHPRSVHCRPPSGSGIWQYNARYFRHSKLAVPSLYATGGRTDLQTAQEWQFSDTL